MANNASRNFKLDLVIVASFTDQPSVIPFGWAFMAPSRGWKLLSTDQKHQAPAQRTTSTQQGARSTTLGVTRSTNKR